MSNSAAEVRELDVVALLRDRPDDGLSAGQTGTVLLVHGDGEAFEVEFILAPRRSVITTVGRADLLKLHGCRQTAAAQSSATRLPGGDRT